MKRSLSSGDIAGAVIRLHGRTYAEQLGVDPGSASPEALYRLLIACLLASTRISWKIALEGAKALSARGWTTPDKMLHTTWAGRVKVLDGVHYVRYDESMSRKIEAATKLVIQKYRGDLNNLRTAAGQDPRRERELLEEFKGIGDTGADIFFREVQPAWEELYPFVDRRAADGAKMLGLPAEPAALACLVDRQDFPKLVFGLVRVALDRCAAQVLAEARALSRETVTA
jgi:hypothetical protein